jgi:hypothetical protein
VRFWENNKMMYVASIELAMWRCGTVVQCSRNGDLDTGENDADLSKAETRDEQERAEDAVQPMKAAKRVSTFIPASPDTVSWFHRRDKSQIYRDTT